MAKKVKTPVPAPEAPAPAPAPTPAPVKATTKPVASKKITAAQRQNIRIALLSAGVAVNDARIEHVIDQIERAVVKGEDADCASLCR